MKYDLGEERKWTFAEDCEEFSCSWCSELEQISSRNSGWSYCPSDRHPGLNEQLKNIETHGAVRYDQSVIWKRRATLPFNKPNRGLRSIYLSLSRIPMNINHGSGLRRHIQPLTSSLHT